MGGETVYAALDDGGVLHGECGSEWVAQFRDRHKKHRKLTSSPPFSRSLSSLLLFLKKRKNPYKKKSVIDAAGGSVWNSGGSVLSQLRSSARDAATVALQVGSVAKEKALAAAGSAFEAGKGLAGAAIGAGKAALARATGGSGGGGAGESA